MSNEIKFTEDEIKSLSDLSTEYQTTQAAFGQISVQRIILDQQSKALDEAHLKLETDYISLQEKEKKLVKQLNDKYGPGPLDPQTGVFPPTEQPKEK